MDFQKLLQQASSNQELVEKKYEKQHLAKVEERRQQERKEWEQKKKDAVRLKEVRERYHREKLRYHGIVDTPPTSKTVASKAASSACSTVSKPHPPKSESHKSRKDCSTTSKSTVKSSYSEGKKPSSMTSKKSPDPSTPSINKPGKPDKPDKPGKPDKPDKSSKKDKASKLHKAVKQVNSSTKKNSSSSSTNDKGKTGKHLAMPNGRVKISNSRSASPLPTQRPTTPSKTTSKSTKPSYQTHDFKELLKIANQNKTTGRPLEARPADTRTKALPSSTPQSSSPLGKSLLERSHLKARGGLVRSDPSLKAAMASSARASVESGKGEMTGKTSAAIKQGGRVRQDTPPSAQTNLARRPLAGGRPSSPPPTKKAVPGRDIIRSKNSASAQVRPRPGGPPIRGGRPLPGRSGRGGAAATAFYGAAAARILGKDGSSKQPRSSGFGPYRSSWVDEMTDYMRSNDIDPQDYYSDEEEDDDLDGFVASDDEEGDVEDYSSEISKIFGYDRRKYRDADDSAMESSYAQQEFEEIRSARIGRAEDDEELARERGQQRKRTKVKGKPPVLKKSKLSI